MQADPARSRSPRHKVTGLPPSKVVVEWATDSSGIVAIEGKQEGTWLKYE